MAEQGYHGPCRTNGTPLGLAEPDCALTLLLEGAEYGKEREPNGTREWGMQETARGWHEWLAAAQKAHDNAQRHELLLGMC